ncbi:hypothetical protein OCQ_29650 [Mycobacterium paraintracellulare]|nr:hypothetical protein OCQ_29650 [Mycobacterium paraintracellulare]OSC18862.1 peptidase [Mycobacterium paraintracellulare]
MPGTLTDLGSRRPAQRGPSALPTVGDASFPVLETLPEKAANRSAPY